MTDKKYYTLYLRPCRPDFAFTMTEDERAVMTQHVAYWKEKMALGKVIVFGPVFDPKGPYGIGIVQVESEEELAGFIDGDPASTINNYEFFPMNAITPGQ